MLKSKLEKIKRKALDSALSSTSHGLPNIFKTKRLSFKLMWLFFFITCSMIGTFMVFKTTKNYLNYETVTKIDVITEIPSHYPAITFINLRNPMENKSLNEIMIFCSYNNEKCTENDFDIVKDNLGYVSFKFKQKNAYIPGAYYGLQMLIHLGNDTTNSLGIDGLQIIVHNHTLDPNFYGGYSLQGLNAPSGFYSSIALNRIFSHKLGLPYNDCIKDVSSLNSSSSELYKYMIESTNFTYRQKDCFNYCMGREFHRKLNESNKIEHWVNAWFSFENYLKDISTLEFYYNKVKNEISNLCNSDCPLECDGIKYEKTISLTRILMDEFIRYYSDSLNQFSFIKNLTADDLNDLVMFNVYYDELEYTNISQLPKMDFFDLVSNIGGNLGLFIGISFLSLAEIIELFLETIYIFCEKKTFYKLNKIKTIKDFEQRKNNKQIEKNRKRNDLINL